MSSAANRIEMRCIVFGDMVASTPRSVEDTQQGKWAEHIADIMHCLDLWHELLHPFHMEFFRPMGDGFLATFPAPALTALYAVVHACEAWEKDPVCRGFPMRIGMHVGSVIVKPDGDPQGPDVNRAQRIMSQAGGGEVLVSSAYADMVGPYLPPDYALHDLGKHRLKGFKSPVRLYRVSAPGLPDRPRVCSRDKPDNLPVALDPFVGRKQERVTLRRLLTDTVRRGITLTGPAGCGKTRLAVEVAREIQSHFPDGVHFVALEEATGADGVLARIATTLSIPLSIHTDPHEALRIALAELRTLLILDNFEQVLSAAGVVAGLLKALPSLHILVTSRVRLGYQGEQVRDLDPLPVPPESAGYPKIQNAESVKLFVERAKAANSRFRLTPANAADVAALCRIVEGLPLALEIVAAQVRYRPLSRLREMRAELLDISAATIDAPERQRSLRATFDWSYEHLSASDRLLLAQLSLFETAFDDDEVFEVCTGRDLEAGLHRLQDSGLVCRPQEESSRPYRLPVPVREYARERLGRPTDTLRTRFIAAFTRRAQHLHDLWRHHAEAKALHGIRTDLENFRVAWSMACEDDRQEVIADLGLAVTFFATALPQSANIEPWLDRTERVLRQRDDKRRLGFLANTRARLAGRRGEFGEALKHQRASLDSILEAGLPAERADAHSTLAYFALRAQDYPTAERYAELGMQLGRRHGAKEPEAVAYLVLAQVLKTSHRERAKQLAEHSLALFREQGICRGMSHADIVLAEIAEADGEPAAAEIYYRDALSLCMGEGEDVQVVRCLEFIAGFYARHDNADMAADLLAAAAGAKRILGMPPAAGLELPKVVIEKTGAIPLDAAVERVLSASPVTA
jgi:predicted ATPase/class 3 adenylate cyclase